MTNAVASDFRTLLADCIDASHQTLASQWLDELKQLVAVEPDDIFPGDELLGQVPALISEIAAFLRDGPSRESITANAVVTARATELGRLRHAQCASVHQVLREYRVLRTILARFIDEEVIRHQLTPNVHEVVELMNRLEAAVDVLLQTTVDTFVAEYTRKITEHTARLEGFNRMVTHELRQPLGIFQFALKLLATEEAWRDGGARAKLLGTAARNVTRMEEMLGKLVALSRSGDAADSALVQRVDVAAMTNDVVDQLREMADARGVDVRVATPMPTLVIDAARLELVLVNLISNAIKYSDPAKPSRFVEIATAASSRSEVCALTVRDNGIGVAEGELHLIFGRFYRGQPERDGELGTNGLGLGLSIVADCMDAVNGHIRVESILGEGTTFIVDLPVMAAP